jgi:hypothetical protein
MPAARGRDAFLALDSPGRARRTGPQNTDYRPFLPGGKDPEGKDMSGLYMVLPAAYRS